MRSSLVCAIAAGSLFLLLSVILIPYAGIQDDEALFTTPLYLHIGNEFRVRILHHDVFLMVMSYIGTLKTAIFAPIFLLFGTNLWSLRLPVAVTGAITVFVFYFLTEKSSGRWVACLAALLLATDPVFLLTNAFDWGPVAMEHVLLVTACWFLYQFARNARTETPRNSETEPRQPLQTAALWAPKSNRGLILGFLCLGLALWNKAVFVWALAGLSVATLAVFGSEIRRLATRRRVWTAAAAFLIGALPLVVYNVRHRSATLSQNARLDFPGPAHKWIQLVNAANGSSLFAYMVSEEWATQPKPADSRVGRVAVWLREHLGERRQTGFYYLFGLLLAAVPLWWRSKTSRFSLVFVAVTWLAMAVTRDAGGSAHHVILLWPFPLLFAAIALNGLSRFPAGKWIASTVGLGMIMMNLVVLNQYLVQFERNGPALTFTDAIFPLSEQLKPLAARPVYVIDWGMFNVLTFLHQGRLDLRVGSEPLMSDFLSDSPSDSHRILIGKMISDSSAVFVGHTAGEEMFPMVNERLDRAAASLGYRKEVLQTITDSNARPRFEIFSFRPINGF